MSFYKPLATTQMITDACSVGLGAVIAQLKENGDDKLVANSSWLLIDVELWYSKHKNVVTPTFTLLYIWPTCYNHNWSWTFGEVAFSYIKLPSTNQRWFLRLQSYNCILRYPPGNSNAADGLSRNPKATNSSSNENIAEQHINSVSIHEPSKNWATHHKQPCITCYRKTQINGTNN